MAMCSELLIRAAIALAATTSSALATEHELPVAQAQQRACGRILDQHATTPLPGAADCGADGQASALLQAVGGLSVAVQEVTPAWPDSASKSKFDHLLLPQSGDQEIVTSVDAPLQSGAAHPSKRPLSATQGEPETNEGAREIPEIRVGTEESGGASETPETTGGTAEGAAVAEPTTPTAPNGTVSSNSTASVAPVPQANGLPSPFNFDSFNCSSGMSRWKTGWSLQKKAWCCSKANVGCPFNCTAGLARWRTGWSVVKKDWCCNNKRIGCLFNCSAGALRWKRGWSKAKKDWCCQNQNFGCEGEVAKQTTTTGVPTEITTMLTTTTAAKPTTTAITTTITTTPFDCQAGILRAAIGWSKEKQAWCCTDQQVGCIKGDEMVFDCSQGIKNWETGWSIPKKEFCCRTSRVGCETGIADSDEGSSEEGSEEGAEEGKEEGEGGTDEGESKSGEEGEGEGGEGGEEGEGGEGGESGEGGEGGEEGSEEKSEEEDKLFNCSAGVLHWKEGWSEIKKAYCCNAEGIGCTGPRTRPCVTKYDPMVYSTLRYSAAKPGSPCIFNADPRDEGWHCILDGMSYGSNGWCWTDLQMTTYGACSEDCPLFSQQKVLGDRMKRMEQKLDRLLNASGVNVSDLPSADSPLTSAPVGRGESAESPAASPPAASPPAEAKEEEGGHGHR